MECPHIINSVKIHNSVKSKDKVQIEPESTCSACTTKTNIWLCLSCGKIGCGRYANGHALEHFKNNADHAMCMDCHGLSVYCYKCDDFVINDTPIGLLESLKKIYKSPDNIDEIQNKDEESPLNESIDNDDKIIINVRNLRPRARKRSYFNQDENKQTTKTKETNSKVKNKKVVGLRNLGNTCFMNAVLQSLSNIEEFSYYLKQLDLNKNGTKSLPPSCNVIEELRKILITLNQGGSKGAISPESLFMVIWKVVPRFRGYQQQDAHEFLRYILDRLHTELLQLLPDFTSNQEPPYISLGTSERSSIVTTVFGGTLQSEVRCLNCSTESKTNDPFLDLSLDIPERFHKKPKDEPLAPICDISDCLTSFIEVEELADTELYYCNACKSKQKSTKRFWIRRLPNVLCLHLKRFRWQNFFRYKIDASIAFPLTALDMSQFVLNNIHGTRRKTGSNLYDLAAVIVHHGSGAGSGHYTAFAINDGNWFHFNDSSVRSTEVSVVANCKPYILFYIRRKFRLPKF